MLAVFALWLILNGRVTPEILAFGAALTALAGALAHAALDYTPRTELRLLRALPLGLAYAALLVWEIAKAALSVLRMALSRRSAPDPVIVEFESGFTGVKAVVLANTITLTPGTCTLFCEGGHLVVHCLRPEFAKGLSDSAFARLLRKM